MSVDITSTYNEKLGPLCAALFISTNNGAAKRIVFLLISDFFTFSLMAQDLGISIRKSQIIDHSPKKGKEMQKVESIKQKRLQVANGKEVLCQKVELDGSSPKYVVETYIRDTNLDEVLLIVDKVERPDINMGAYISCRMGNYNCENVFRYCPGNTPNCKVPGSHPLNTTKKK